MRVANSEIANATSCGEDTPRDESRKFLWEACKARKMKDEGKKTKSEA
jgi:hypothetical protein